MKIVGPHVHTTGGVQNAPLNAFALHATGFAMFTKNQRRWEAKPLERTTVDLFRKNLDQCGYRSQDVLVHGSYLINIGHPDTTARRKSIDALVDELERCTLLGLPWLNIHPGSHLGAMSEQECLDAIVGSINFALDATKEAGVVIETTAGQGSNMGYKFEHLASILDKVEDRSRVGVCIDTCHIFAAGYDISNRDGYFGSMKEFEDVVGGAFLRGAHLNDCKTGAGSRVDRHESLGKGRIGTDAFRFLMNDSRFDDIPLILETTDETLWESEISLLNSFCLS